MGKNIRLDHKGLAQILQSEEMHHLVQETAEQIGRNVEAQGITVGSFKGGTGEIPVPVEVDVTTMDRAHGRVTLAHPAGIAVQAKHGALTKAASAVGLEVHSD